VYEGKEYHFMPGLLSPPDHQVVQGRILPEDIPVSLNHRGPFQREFQFLHTKFSPIRGAAGMAEIWILLPFFFSVLLSINLGAFIASRSLFPLREAPEAREIPEIREIPLPVEPSIPFEPFEGLSFNFLREPETRRVDFILDTYRNPETKEWVVGFFERICGSLAVAQAILEGADRYSISPSLAFALCWEESRFNPLAVNRKNQDGSIDRGLFQLNNRSFPKLTEAEFFNYRTNAFYGMAHLRICIDTGGSELSAAAMYNAGTWRVRSGGTPHQTLNYAERIFSSSRKVEAVFLETWARRSEIPQNPPAAAEEESPDPPPETPDPRNIRNLLPVLLFPISR
jgi:hypothetical protein